MNQESEELLRPLVAERVGVGPGPLQVRLAAAAATAAIRIALETWSETDADVTGPGSPADLAARCLDRLMGPGW